MQGRINSTKQVGYSSLAQEDCALAMKLVIEGLVFPGVNAVEHNYVIHQVVMPSQCRLVTYLIMELLAEKETSDFDYCEN